MEPKGKLIPIGGNEAKNNDQKVSETREKNVDFYSEGILSEVLNEMEGENPLIEVLPLASGDQKEMEKKYRDAFSRLGRSVNILFLNSKKDADLKRNLSRIEKADGIFITGGDQKKLKLLTGTKFLSLLKNKYVNNNFVIAGTSAGAMAMPDFMIKQGNGDEILLKGLVQLTDGLNLITNIIIDTHFLNRGRISRLIEAVILKRQHVGIGICEDTALVISKGKNARAIGSGTVTIIEGDKIRESNYNSINNNDPVFINNLTMHILAKGAGYDLKHRKFVVQETGW